MPGNESNPYGAPQADVTKAEMVGRPVPPRSMVGEIIGTVASMVIGALVGLTVGGNGLGFVSFVILCSLLGWVLWSRRKRSIAGTIWICILMVIVWWPIGLMLRELGRELF